MQRLTKRNIKVINHDTGQQIDFPTFGKEAGEDAYNQVSNQLTSLQAQLESSIASMSEAIVTDKTLTIEDAPADAKATGDAINNLRGAVGSPLVAATAAAMTNTNKVYVYTGSETGYTNGNWYYHNGTSWVSGGVYNSVAVDLDSTLTLANKAPDSKVVGDAIGSLNEDITNLSTDVYGETSNNYTEGKNFRANSSGLNVIDDPDACVSDFIPITSWEWTPSTYAIFIYTDDANDPNVYQIIYYDENKNYAGYKGHQPGSTYRKVQNVDGSAYVRFSFRKGFRGLLYNPTNPIKYNWFAGKQIISKGIIQSVGNLTELETEDKSNVVGAINEINNLIFGISTIHVTLYDGYFTGNGLLSSPTDNNEKYTNAIHVSEGDEITVDLQYVTSTNTIWLAYALFTDDKTFIARNNIDITSVGSSHKIIIIPENVSYVSFTFRTYDGASFILTKPFDDPTLTDRYFARINENLHVSTDMINDESVNSSKLSSDILTESRNIFNQKWAHARYNNTGNYEDISKDNSLPTNVATQPNIEVNGGETYTVSWGPNKLDTPSGSIYIHEFDSEGNRISYVSFPYSRYKYTITLNSNTKKIGLMNYTSGNTRWIDLIPDWTQIELGETATEHIDYRHIKDSMIDCQAIMDRIEPKIPDMVVNNPNINRLISNTVRSIAHRGDNVYAPQCVASAYIYARKHGHNIAENDLWLSEDGKFVMWHDITLSRLGNLVDINGYLMYTDGTNFYYVNPNDNIVYTWDGSEYATSDILLSSLTRCAGSDYGVNSEYAQTGLNLDILKRIDFGAYKGEQFKGTQILTFEEWVVLCKQLGMEIYVDKKLTYTDALLTEAANIVKKHGMGKFTSWIGLSVTQINFLRNIIPDARCGTLAHPNPDTIELFSSVNTGRGFYFNGDAKTMTPEAIQLGLDAGFDVEVWYVDTGATEQEQFEVIRNAVSYGVTAMTLDHYRVDEAFAYLM